MYSILGQQRSLRRKFSNSNCSSISSTLKKNAQLTRRKLSFASLPTGWILLTGIHTYICGCTPIPEGRGGGSSTSLYVPRVSNEEPFLDSSLGLLRGGVKKKLVLLGGAHHKVAPPPPSPSCGEGTNFFGRKFFFCLESPETEKKLSDLKVKFLPPFDSNL